MLENRGWRSARHRTILLRKVVASQLLAGWKWRWTMDAQGTMRLMFDTMDAYDRADFDRLAEIYAEDAQWRNADPNGPHCHNRDDIFAMFRQRMDAGIRIAFDELRSTPTQVMLTVRAADFGRVVSVFSSFSGDRSELGSGSTLEGGSVANMRRTTVSLAAVYRIPEVWGQMLYTTS
jgi:hypothetical protein